VTVPKGAAAVELTLQLAVNYHRDGKAGVKWWRANITGTGPIPRSAISLLLAGPPAPTEPNSHNS
jgi:hypothetical protein